MLLDPKYAVPKKIDVKEVKSELEIMLTKIIYKRMNDEGVDSSDSDSDEDGKKGNSLG